VEPRAKPTAIHYLAIFLALRTQSLMIVSYFLYKGKVEAEARAAAAEQRAAARQ
jgi:hypothetical protein